MNIRKVDVESFSSIRSIDIFITAASFEKRCITAAQNLDKRSIKNSIIFSNLRNQQYVRKNLKSLEKILKNTKKYRIDSSDPIYTADNMIKTFSSFQKSRINKIVLDSSTFTHEALLILLKVLSIAFNSVDLIILYNSAKKYSTDSENDNDIWLSRGLKKVRTILGYSGEISPTKKTHLILLAGFEHYRASLLISKIQPDLISIGAARKGTSTKPKHYSANKYAKDLLTQVFATHRNVDEFEFSPSDPIETSINVLTIRDKYIDCNTIVAPLNTKVSTIGCAIACKKDLSIKLIYSEPIVYNFKNYSEPSNEGYILSANTHEFL